MSEKGPTELDKDQGYEPRDVMFGSLGKWVLMLFVLVAVSALVTLFVFRAYRPKYPQASFNYPFPTERELPPDPRIQVHPAQELVVYRKAQEQAIHDYNWVDKKAGVVSIPIERAMDQLLKKGLPTRRPAK